MAKRILLVLVILCVLVGAVPSVFALHGYIRINNGTIVTNEGQRPQVVVQFGNISADRRTIENVDLYCVWPDGFADLGQVQRGPFNTVVPVVISNNEFVEFGASDPLEGFLIDEVDLIPGQNYNVAFNMHIRAARGMQTEIECLLFTNFFDLIDRTSATIRVQ